MSWVFLLQIMILILWISFFIYVVVSGLIEKHHEDRTRRDINVRQSRPEKFI